MHQANLIDEYYNYQDKLETTLNHSLTLLDLILLVTLFANSSPIVSDNW